MRMTALTVDKHDIANGPADRAERVFFRGAIVKQKRHMRREIATSEKRQPLFRHRGGERSSERFQLMQSGIARQHKGSAAWPTAKTRRAVKPDFKQLHLNFSNGLANSRNDGSGQTAKPKQRHM